MFLYGQYCPVARASEILADRWTPLIVRELLAGIHRFNELDRGLPASRARSWSSGCGASRRRGSSSAAGELTGKGPRTISRPRADTFRG
jgi:hypothetical protein